jgi:ribose transport system permease protein
MREANVLIALVVLCLLIYLRNPNFGSLFNIQVIMRQVAIFGLLAIGETIVIITGGIDLSVGAVVAFSGVLQAILLTKLGLPLPLVMVIGLTVVALIGVYHGVGVAKWGIPPFIITLASLSIWRGLSTGMTSSYPVLINDNIFRWLGQGKIWIIPVPLMITLLVALLLSYMLNRTRFGRSIYAVGGNIEAARLSGIRVDRVLIGAYTLAAVLFGLTGTIIAGRMSEGLPSIASGYELNAIAAAIIGGTSFLGGIGSIRGTLLGAALMAVIDNALILLGVSAYWYTLVVGSLIVLAVTIDVISTNRRRRREELFGS